MKKFKKSAISKTYPFPVQKIKLADIDWEINKEFTTLILKKCKLPYLEKFNNEEVGFAIYAYEKTSEASLFLPLNKLGEFPIYFDFFKKGLRIRTSKPHFKIFLYELTTKKIIATTTDLLLIDKNELKSNLPVYPGDIGNRIATVKFNDDGPFLLVSKNFKTKNGEPVYYQRMITILKENPTFTCGFFPIILDEIFKKAYENRKDTKWAKRWIKFANDLVKGCFSENEKLETDDQEFESKLYELTNAWIRINKFDIKLYEDLIGGDYD
tara:strand:- start:1135 stop:1938 length:804 start_codon:yes stop_codon:yes gene_type:complete